MRLSVYLFTTAHDRISLLRNIHGRPISFSCPAARNNKRIFVIPGRSLNIYLPVRQSFSKNIFSFFFSFWLGRFRDPGGGGHQIGRLRRQRSGTVNFNFLFFYFNFLFIEI